MTRLTVSLVLAGAFMVQGTAFAQPGPQPAPGPAPAPESAPAPEPAAPPQTVAPAPAEPPAAPDPEPIPGRVEEQEVLEGGVPPEQVAQGDAPAEEAEQEGAWTDRLGLSLFVDSYYQFDWNLPEVMSANGILGHSAFVNTQGFALAFLGIDATYTADQIGATASLRFGPGATRLIGPFDTLNLDSVWQAYATYMPNDVLTLDFGQFGTIYGAEVAESWLNVNYTRGALYFNYQPFWHQGLRATIAASDAVAIKALIVNGVNEPFDADRSPDFGLQGVFTPNDTVFVALGWYGSPIEPEGKYWANFFDLVVNVFAGPATIVFNADLGIGDDAVADDTYTYYGLSLAAKYAFTEQIAAGLRGEYLGNPDGPAAGFGENLMTGTLTLEYAPVENLIIRLDNRIEKADAEIFFDGDAPSMADAGGVVVYTPNTDTYVSTVLGVVVKTN